VDDRAQLTFAAALEKTMRCDADLPTRGVTIALPGKDNASLIATIFPLKCADRQSHPEDCVAMAAIFVQDPITMPSAQGEAFAELYGLTRCELRVLLAMVPGLSVKETAHALGIAETTVKSHLQHIYSKTGTSKRTELLHLLLSSTPPMAKH
jgi:DNA-binding NarL/FixJ family response regulator